MFSALSPLDLSFRCNFKIGTFHCDSFLNYHLKKNRVNVFNPCYTVQACHIHLSGIKSSDDVDFIKNDPIRIKQENHKGNFKDGVEWCSVDDIKSMFCHKNDIYTSSETVDLSTRNIKGLTAVICCGSYSSSLRTTLEHLHNQVLGSNNRLEIIIVDNSKNGLDEECFANFKIPHPRISTKTVREPKQGQAYARICGYKNSTYKYIGYIDDDNWVAPNWVETAINFMDSNPDVGICGGLNTAKFDGNPPQWFSSYQGNYAVGRQSLKSGDITWSRGFVWGAGMVVRRASLNKLLINGFKPIFPGHIGSKVGSADDLELNLAIRLAGWRIWYLSSLRLVHYIPKHKTTLRYLTRLRNSGGISSVCREMYTDSRTVNSDPLKWNTVLRNAVLDLLVSPFSAYIKILFMRSNDREVSLLGVKIGYLKELLVRKNSFQKDVNRISQALWNNNPQHIDPKTVSHYKHFGFRELFPNIINIFEKINCLSKLKKLFRMKELQKTMPLEYHACCNEEKLTPLSKNSLVLCTVPSLASVHIAKIFRKIALWKDLIPVDYEKFFFKLGSINDSLINSSLFKSSGYYYGPLRTLHDISEIADYNIVFYLHDPRNALLGEYFKKGISSSPDHYVLNNIDRIVEIYKKYCDHILNFPGALLLKHEDLVNDPRAWIETILSYIDLDISSLEKESLVDHINMLCHLGTSPLHDNNANPDYYKKHLSSETIRKLDDAFVDVLYQLNYSVSQNEVY